MVLGDLLFKLHKLTIEGYGKPTRKIDSALGLPLEVQYNPESLTIRHPVAFQGRQSSGATGRKAEWSHNPPRRLTVNLVVDGTGADSMGIEVLIGVKTVAERIKDLVKLCYLPKSTTHEPSYLTLKWQNGVLGDKGFKCRLESLDVNYTAFNRDGSPLHADLTAGFVEQVTTKEQAQEANQSSPDLTHRRVVKEGDTLPLLCHEIYGSAAHYLRVAQANGLVDFRSLTAGQEIFFPPFERPRKK